MSEEFDGVRTILPEAVEAHAFPAACIEVGGHDASRWTASVGAYTFDPYAPLATAGTIFDLASLTKVIATTTLAMRAADAGRLTLDDPVAHWLPDWRGTERAGVTVRQLLTHTAGVPQMPAGTTVEQMCDWNYMTEAVAALTPRWETGTHVAYHAYTFGWLAG